MKVLKEINEIYIKRFLVSIRDRFFLCAIFVIENKGNVFFSCLLLGKMS